MNQSDIINNVNIKSPNQAEDFHISRTQKLIIATACFAIATAFSAIAAIQVVSVTSAVSATATSPEASYDTPYSASTEDEGFSALLELLPKPAEPSPDTIDSPAGAAEEAQPLVQ